MEARKVKIRFDKWKHTTTKAHLLVYKEKEVWLSKKICWNLEVAGNDLHAWAEVPAFIFKELTGHDLNEAAVNYGSEDMRKYFGAIVTVEVEKHIPQKKQPVKISADDSLTR